MPTKTPSKKRTTSKSSVAKRPAAKKVVTKRKAPTKKKGLRRLLEIRKKGSATRKGIFIGAGVVVVAAIAFTGYALWQGNGANAGGTSTLGRGWTYLGYLNWFECSGSSCGPGGSHSSTAFDGADFYACRDQTSSGEKIETKMTIKSSSSDVDKFFYLVSIGSGGGQSTSVAAKAGATAYYTSKAISSSSKKVYLQIANSATKLVYYQNGQSLSGTISSLSLCSSSGAV